jgi:hypothetical protein
MIKVNITSLAQDLVGNVATVRADIMENAGAFFRVKDSIEVEIEGGARMTHAELEEKLLEVYNG